MKTSTLMTSLPLPAPFMEAFREAAERLDDGPLSPPIDLLATPSAIIAKVALPGVRREDIDISVGDDVVTIHGSTEGEGKLAAAHHTHRELSHGRFSRTFRLPTAVSVEGARASLRDGLLTLALPKASEPTGTVATIPVS